jgi:hypothetical protein
MSKVEGRASGRPQAGPHPLGGSVDVLSGRGAPVSLVGAGPGDPELLTVRALKRTRHLPCNLPT